jgi:hypothetical protein
MAVSRNAPKGTVARCQGCGHVITAVHAALVPGRWKDSQGAHCEAHPLGMHRP